MKILLTGGGTAGHIYPIVSVIETLKQKPEIEYLYVGSRQGPEKEIAKNLNIPYKGLIVGKWRTYFSFSNYYDLAKTFIGLIQAFFILISFRPNVIFAKGGYVTFPIIMWTKILGFPLVIHESDAIMGRANSWAASFAKKICVGFPEKYYQDIVSKKAVFTGIPVRQEFFNKPTQATERKTILITGGSQGAHPINSVVSQIMPQLLNQYEVYHLSGSRDLNGLKKESFAGDQHYHLSAFSENIADLMAKADLIISRAGATTFAEIGALKKAAVLIPYAAAAGDHQNFNAKIFKEMQAAEVLLEENLTPSSLLSIINRLMEDDEKRLEIGRHAEEFARRDSAQKITEILSEVGNG